MRVDSDLASGLSDSRAEASSLEQAGYAGVFFSEIRHDPFLPLVLAAYGTENIQLGTSVAIAFARSPMTTAGTSWDINKFSNGRLILGIGSQIKPHIEKRFSMPWSHPALRMREYVCALQAIWDAWQHGTKLNFRGDFYTHTLMTPMFDPGASEVGPPKVFVAAVGGLMTRVASEVADGLLVHPFTTERYVREVTLPIVQTGLASSERSRGEFETKCPVFVVTSETEEGFANATSAVRKQIAFYASTPAYRPVLELHGWGELQTKLNILSKRGEWDTMGELVDDDILRTFAIVGEPHEIAPAIQHRFSGLFDRVSLYTPYPIDRSVLDNVARALDAS